MDLLYKICLVSTIVLFSVVFIAVFVVFCTSIYSCFTKKVPGKLIAKIAVMLGFGCICPWILWIILTLIKALTAL